MKPSVGTLSSVTWVGRGTYASVKKTLESYRKEGRRIATNLFDPTVMSSRESLNNDGDDETFSVPAKQASALSGFHPKVCQHIIDEFMKIEAEHAERLLSGRPNNYHVLNHLILNISPMENALSNKHQ